MFARPSHRSARGTCVRRKKQLSANTACSFFAQLRVPRSWYAHARHSRLRVVAVSFCRRRRRVVPRPQGPGRIFREQTRKRAAGSTPGQGLSCASVDRRAITGQNRDFPKTRRDPQDPVPVSNVRSDGLADCSSRRCARARDSTLRSDRTYTPAARRLTRRGRPARRPGRCDTTRSTVPHKGARLVRTVCPSVLRESSLRARRIGYGVTCFAGQHRGGGDGPSGSYTFSGTTNNHIQSVDRQTRRYAFEIHRRPV